MSDVTGTQGPKAVQPVARAPDKAKNVRDEHRQAGADTRQNQQHTRGRGNQDTQAAAHARDPAVSIAPTTVHLQVGQKLDQTITQLDSEERPIIETELATYALRPDAGLKKGDDVILEIRQAGKKLTADLLVRNGNPIDPPVRLTLVVVALHGTPDGQQQKQPPPAGNPAQPYSPPDQHAGASSVRTAENTTTTPPAPAFKPGEIISASFTAAPDKAQPIIETPSGRYEIATSLSPSVPSRLTLRIQTPEPPIHAEIIAVDGKPQHPPALATLTPVTSEIKPPARDTYSQQAEILPVPHTLHPGQTIKQQPEQERQPPRPPEQQQVQVSKVEDDGRARIETDFGTYLVSPARIFKPDDSVQLTIRQPQTDAYTHAAYSQDSASQDIRAEVHAVNGRAFNPAVEVSLEKIADKQYHRQEVQQTAQYRESAPIEQASGQQVSQFTTHKQEAPLKAATQNHLLAAGTEDAALLPRKFEITVIRASEQHPQDQAPVIRTPVGDFKIKTALPVKRDESFSARLADHIRGREVIQILLEARGQEQFRSPIPATLEPLVQDTYSESSPPHTQPGTAGTSGTAYIPPTYSLQTPPTATKSLPATQAYSQNPDPSVTHLNSNDLATLISLQQSDGQNTGKNATPPAPAQVSQALQTSISAALEQAGITTKTQPPTGPQAAAAGLSASVSAQNLYSLLKAPNTVLEQLGLTGQPSALAGTTLAGATLAGAISPAVPALLGPSGAPGSYVPVSLVAVDTTVSKIPPALLSQVQSIEALPTETAKQLNIPVGLSAQILSSNNGIAAVDTPKGTFLVAESYAGDLIGKDIAIIPQTAPGLQAQATQTASSASNVSTPVLKTTARLVSRNTTTDVKISFSPDATSSTNSQADQTSQTTQAATPQVQQTTIEAVHINRAYLSSDGPKNDIFLETKAGNFAMTIPAQDRPAIGAPLYYLQPASISSAVPFTTPGDTAALPFSDMVSAHIWPSLGMSYSIIADTSATALAQFTQRSAAGGTHFPQALLHAAANLQHGTLESWLGKAATDLIRQEDQSLLDRLRSEWGQMQTVMTEGGSEWRGIMIPMDTPRDNDPSMLSFLFRTEEEKGSNGEAEADGDGNTEDDGAGSKQFLLEFELSEVGPVQLDGRIQDRHMEIIMRTHMKLPASFTASLTRLYDEAVLANGFTGHLQIEAVTDFPLYAAALITP